MFSRFTAALYNAVDALAPPLPLHEDFVWHWKAVTKYYTSKNASNKLPVEMTGIPDHLLEMLSILDQEVKELEEGSVGPCMEYIMNHRVLDTMCVLATADAPSGMKRYMLIFATRFLQIIQQFLIPHISIHVAVTNFIKLCGEVPAAPTEKEEMDLLEVICKKLNENAGLICCFMETSVENRRDAELCHTSRQGKQNFKPEPTSASKEENTLVLSLLKLFFSPDKVISAKASSCLKVCCSLADDEIATSLVENCDPGFIMCNNIVKLYNLIPKTIKLSEVEDPFEGEDVSVNCRISSDKRKFLCYLQQLNLIDMLVQEAHQLISDSVVKFFRMQFLETVVYEDILKNENDVNLFVTTLLSTSIRCVSSSKLIMSIELFILGDLQAFSIDGHSSHIVKDLLIERCRNAHLSIPLSMVSMQLLEDIMQKPTQFIVQNLIIGYIDRRGYYDCTAADDWSSFLEEESAKHENNDAEVCSTPVNETFAPPYIHRILDAFLSLVHDELKSAETEEDSGYDTYIKEAHGRFMKCCVQCEYFDWPHVPMSREECYIGTEDDSSSDSQPEADSCWKFYEGPFLSMLFDKLENILELPYDINLQVTSLISQLALLPHPNLHEYLLNPFIPLGPGVRSLFSVMLKVVENIQVEVKKVKSFKQKLRLTRKSLLGDDSTSEPFEESNILEALIVIEEFCKELAAIAFVKYNAAS